MERIFERFGLEIKCLFIVIVCIMFFATATNMLKDNDDSSLQHEGSAVELTSAEAGIIIIPGFDKIRFKAGEKYQSVLFSNPARNSAEMAVKFIVDDNIIYESGLISPGQCVNEIEISKVFKAGNYDCIVEYQFYKDEVQLNGARNKCELEVY